MNSYLISKNNKMEEEVEYQNTNDLFEGDLVQISENPKSEIGNMSLF